MLGAVAGDVVGSVFEARPYKGTDFSLFSRGARFTDDSVLTLAVASAIVEDVSYREALWTIGRRYPDAGYGASFIGWLADADPRPYNSFGNGAAMRVSPVGWAFDDEAAVLAQARAAAAISHDHPEGIKGAQAVALAVLRGRQGSDFDTVRAEITRRFGYDLERSVAAIRPHYDFDVTCQGSVPEAIICALEAASWEEAVRYAVSLGGDADTQACMAGAIAEACFGLPDDVAEQALAHLSPELRAVHESFWRAVARAG